MSDTVFYLAARFIAWPVLVLGFWFSFSTHAVNVKKLEKTRPPGSMLSVLAYKRNRYWTQSINGSGPMVTPDENSIPLAQFHDGLVTLEISADPTSLAAVKSVPEQLRYLPGLPAQINRALSWLGIEPFPLTIEVVLLAVPERSISYETPKRKAVPPIELRYYINLDEEEVKKFASYMGIILVETLPHELFHFIAKWKKFPTRRSELRSETYAHLFGKCAAYPLIQDIRGIPSNLVYEQDAFIHPEKDLKKLRKRVKSGRFNGHKLPKSLVAQLISQYYFQAVAKNYTGKNIQSDRIPVFCEKLFREHDFSWPIEKKPPPWFAEFIAQKGPENTPAAAQKSSTPVSE